MLAALETIAAFAIVGWGLVHYARDAWETR
jgi:hypothetical protein